MAKQNTYDTATPALADFLTGVDRSDTLTDPNGATKNFLVSELKTVVNQDPEVGGIGGGNGTVTVNGDVAASTDGGAILLKTASDYTATIAHYRIRARADDLYIEKADGTDLARYDRGTGTWEFIGDMTVSGSLSSAGVSATGWPPPDFESAEQTITNASGLNVAHGLGAKPSHVEAVLVCKTTEGNCAVGDEVALPSKDAVSSSVYNFIMGWDATNVTVVTCASGVQIANKTTGAATTLTNSNWRIVVRAWA